MPNSFSYQTKKSNFLMKNYLMNFLSIFIYLEGLNKLLIHIDNGLEFRQNIYQL